MDRLRTLLLVIGIVAVAVVVAGYLFLMLDQANADLLETTASLQETTADLQETTIELEIRKALNVNLESENSALLSQKEGLESARSALEVSLGDALSESAGLQVDLRVANAQAQEQEARYERLSSERDDLAAQHEDLGFRHSDLQVQYEKLGLQRDDLADRHEDLGFRHSDLQVQYEKLGLQRDDLADRHEDLGFRHSDLQAQYEKLGLQRDELAAQFEDLSFRHSDLQLAVGTVDDLRTKASALRDEIEELEEWRRPLILALDSAATSGFKCTGSMEPTITCLDRATFLTNFRPEDIVVGATISFNPNCWEDGASGRGAAHRVADIELRGGIYHYWPKGDASDEPDGCWIPQTSVRGYIIEIHKNAVPENAELRDQVNAARAAFVAAREAYRDLLEGYCGSRDPDGCYLDPRPYAEVDEAYERALEAQEHWRCWYENAGKSEYPGHIPHEC